MENRFGVKDFFLFTLIVALMGVVILGMFQYDRQWDLLQSIQKNSDEQAKDLADVKRQTNASRQFARQTELLQALQKQSDAQSHQVAELQAHVNQLNSQLVAVKAQSDNQVSALAQIQHQLEQGVRTTNASAPAVIASSPPAPSIAAGPATQPGSPTPPPVVTVETGADDPFVRIKAATTQPDYAEGDWYVDSGPNSDKITPLVSGDSFAADVQDHVLESLVKRDPITLEYGPMLALPGWQVEDNVGVYQAYRKQRSAAGVSDADFLKDPNRPVPIRIHFKLRPGIVFSDGVPMTVDDIVWTFNWIMNPNVDAARARSVYSKIRRVVKTGDDEVTFEFDQPYFDAVGLAGGIGVMPQHFYEKYSTEEFNKSTGLLLGSGPYKMPDPTSWSPGQQVSLVRNEKYWGQPSAIDRLVYRIIVSDLPRLTAFTNGELDSFAAQPEQYKSLLKDQDVLGRTQHFEYDTPTAGYRFIAWSEIQDGKPTRFADKRVRQAMTLLTDRQRICDDIMLGLANPATGPFNRLGKQNDPNIVDWPFDVDRAKELLKQAGYVDDGSGQLKGPDGQPFTFKLTYPTGSATYDRMVLFLKDSYARAGITLEPDRMDWSVFSDRLKSHQFEAISLGWTAGLENDIYQMFDSKNIADRGDDFMSYRNPQLDALIEQARETVDPKVRFDLWHQCHAIIHEDQPYTFLFTRKATVFIVNRIKNVERVPTGINALDEWYVPTALQKWEQ